MEMILWFFILRSFNVKKYINRLLNIEPLLHSWHVMKKLHLVMLLLMFYLVLFASVLLWIKNLMCRVRKYACMHIISGHVLLPKICVLHKKN